MELGSGPWALECVRTQSGIDGDNLHLGLPHQQGLEGLNDAADWKFSVATAIREELVLSNPHCDLHGRQDFLEEMLRAFHAIPGAVFVFQCKHAGEVVVQHDAYIALNVRLVEAIPKFCVDRRVSVGG